MGRLKQKFSDFIWNNISFPNGCEPGGKYLWMLKDNCPVCISNPIEHLTIQQYRKKYRLK